MEKIVAISVGLLIMALIFPVALVTLANATLDGVDGTVVTVVTVLVPVLAAIGLALWFMPRFRSG